MTGKIGTGSRVSADGNRSGPVPYHARNIDSSDAHTNLSRLTLDVLLRLFLTSRRYGASGEPSQLLLALQMRGAPALKVTEAADPAHRGANYYVVAPTNPSVWGIRDLG